MFALYHVECRLSTVAPGLVVLLRRYPRRTATTRPSPGCLLSYMLDMSTFLFLGIIPPTCISARSKNIRDIRTIAIAPGIISTDMCLQSKSRAFAAARVGSRKRCARARGLCGSVISFHGLFHQTLQETAIVAHFGKHQRHVAKAWILRRPQHPSLPSTPDVVGLCCYRCRSRLLTSIEIVGDCGVFQQHHFI